MAKPTTGKPKELGDELFLGTPLKYVLESASHFILGIVGGTILMQILKLATPSTLKLLYDFLSGHFVIKSSDTMTTTLMNIGVAVVVCIAAALVIGMTRLKKLTESEKEREKVQYIIIHYFPRAVVFLNGFIIGCLSNIINIMVFIPIALISGFPQILALLLVGAFAYYILDEAGPFLLKDDYPTFFGIVKILMFRFDTYLLFAVVMAFLLFGSTFEMFVMNMLIDNFLKW